MMFEGWVSNKDLNPTERHGGFWVPDAGSGRTGVLCVLRVAGLNDLNFKDGILQEQCRISARCVSSVIRLKTKT